MLNNINKNIRKYYNKIQSYKEVYKNFNIINSYNEILKYKVKNNDLEYKNIIIDGGFYNLGYLYRLQLLRASLYSKEVNEHAYIWDCNQYLCKNIINSIGIKNISYVYKNYSKEKAIEADLIAKKIKKKINILNYPFKYGVPGSFLYDAILKSQKSETVNINDKNLNKYILKFISSIEFSENLIKEFKPDLILLSHGISYQCAPLAWIGSKKQIPVIISYGQYGTPRFWKISAPKDIFFGIGHPVKKDIHNLDEKKKDKLIKIGQKYLTKRTSGLTKDIGGRNAFNNKEDKLEISDLSSNYKNVVAIYLGNWFDFPHMYGMSRFIDVFDWIKSTIKYASKNKNILWLIKPHPLTDWYGGLTLKDILKEKLPRNIVILPNIYSGKKVMENVDALITIHGTSAIEYAAYGKPVLVSDKGWYENFGFVKYPVSKEEYLSCLEKDWFKSLNIKKIQRDANLFAGLYFGKPSWQKKSVLPDDADRKLLRKYLPNFVKDNSLEIKREIKFINDWIKSDMRDYHTFKMINSRNYTI
ncbi:MAG: hypothetical protein JJ847_04845 [Prochlorococcus marinus CUG1438]|nr:hypothetical protein [Prochlorococcus marinus CUG1438]